MAAPSFSATIVTYRTPARLLECALRSLGVAVAEARAAGEMGEVAIHVVDNSPSETQATAKHALAAWPAACGTIALHAGHGNVGYGRANNLVVPTLASDLHLVMNPDVELAPDALRHALAALRENPTIGMVAPAVRGEDGAPQYLCKRYPSVWVLFLRGFAPAGVRRRYQAAIDSYEMRDVIGEALVPRVPLASGAFMLMRTALMRNLGGFDPAFFMYFEDYDLSVRLGREAAVAYVPQAKVVHHGGDAARKGLRHVLWFMTSAWRFFARHGWKLR